MGGKGTMTIGSGAWVGPYSFKSRFEDGAGTNPEELIAAAHAGCYSMALSGALTRNSTPPTEDRDQGQGRSRQGRGGLQDRQDPSRRPRPSVPGIDAAKFQEIAETAKKNCPVSKVLAAAEITLDAKLA